MSVRFIFGRAGVGKTRYCLDEIRGQLRNDPQGAALIYLVPDQMTFQSEHALVASGDISGMVRGQVFSFSRLAWKVLQETGGLARMHLTTVGTNMLLRKIVEQQKANLRAFQRAADRPGFIEKTADMLTEFKRYRIHPDVFLQTEAGFEQNQALQDKLHDLELIYGQFERELAGRYVESEDYLRLLAEKMAYSTYIHNAHIWIDGFHSFTPNEYFVLRGLIKYAKRVTITLTLDSPSEGDPAELDLFYESKVTYRKLETIVTELGVSLEEPVILAAPQRFQHPSLQHLEAEYDRRPANPFQGEAALRLAAAVHRRAEVEAVAREILSLVRDEGFRFRDIGVMVRHLSSYGKLIATIFSDYEIPFFLDEKRPMLHHPLIEFIRSSLEVIVGHWRYEAVFRAVKTDFFVPFASFARINEFREEMDRFENMVIQLGIEGNRWKQEDVWKQKIYRQLEDDLPDTETGDERLLELRSLVVEPLARFERELKAAKTGEEMAQALYYFLTSLQVPEKMAYWLKKAEAAGELSIAREHEQAWKAVVSFLDEMVELIGTEEISLDLFAKMVDAGLDSMTFALVPPAIDQVMIGSLDRSRFTNVKCAFLIGANEGALPAKPLEDGILTEEERELLANAGVALAPGSRRRLLDEQFYIYQALTTASAKLWVSYPLADEEGKSLFPSPVVHRLHELFPNLEEALLLAEPEDGCDQLRFVTHSRKTLSYLAEQIRNWQLGNAIDPIWWDVYNVFVENDDKHASRLLLNSLFFKNEAASLTKETSTALYGETVQVSVSRMERFQACAFQQFAAHGLRLRERAVFRLDAPDIGELFHASLNRIAAELRQQSIEWSSLSESQCFELADRYVNLLAPKLQSQILLSSNRHHYLTRKLKQIVGRAAVALSQQAKRSGFSPVGLEVKFGERAPIPPLTYTLKNGTKLEVIGRIDRVDRAVSDQGMLLRVVDYKSSVRDLSLAEVYFGIAMQMLTYLDVVLTHAPKWLGSDAIPAGVLYFHVHNPMLQTKNVPEASKIERELFKKFKMNGWVLEDLEAVSLMDEDVLEKDSDIVPVAFKKDGSFKKYSKVVSIQQLNALRAHVRNLVQTIGTKMTDGVIDISPYKLKEQTPCSFCSFRSFCQFDSSLPENNYRLLKAEKDDVILDKIVQEKEGEDD